jgi:hypothetical protein
LQDVGRGDRVVRQDGAVGQDHRAGGGQVAREVVRLDGDRRAGRREHVGSRLVDDDVVTTRVARARDIGSRLASEVGIQVILGEVVELGVVVERRVGRDSCHVGLR